MSSIDLDSRPELTAAEPPCFETLRFDLEDDGIGVLTLDRPSEGNAMSPTMLRELPEATAWLADRAPLRGLVLTGAGESFSVGGDLSALKDILDAADIDVAADCRFRVDQLHQAVLNLRRIRVPLVAAVNGLAAGSGFALALACDDRIASDRAAFTAAYGRVGLTPDGGLSYFLPRAVGEMKARSWLLGDALIRAKTALQEGMVSRIVPADELVDAARRRARRLADLAPRYTAITKMLVARSLQSSLAEQLQLERHSFADSAATVDFRRGIKAYFSGARATFAGD